MLRAEHGNGIGAYYHTDEAVLMRQLREAAQGNLCITFFFRNILKGANAIRMPTALLKKDPKGGPRPGALRGRPGRAAGRKLTQPPDKVLWALPQQADVPIICPKKGTCCCYE